MDFVSRLKKFLEVSNIPVTQFADNCRIPRPTLSQLLNGRNKKVSDEVIGKIHEAYPDLSVLWLMFGEGNMTFGGGEAADGRESEAGPMGGLGDQLSFEDVFSGEEAEAFAGNPRTVADQSGHSTIDFSTDATPEASPAAGQAQGSPIERMALKEENGFGRRAATAGGGEGGAMKKRIVNIIVYYDDNSFESFVPAVHK